MFAQGSQHEMSYVEEAEYGVTPSTPSMKLLRHTDTDLTPSKGELVSDEKRADRQIVDVRHGNEQTGGNIDFELSYGSFDDFLAGVLAGAWVSDDPQAGTDSLKAGTAKTSFTIERRFTDIDRYHVYTGCLVNTMNLSLQTEAMITGQFGVIGKGVTLGGTELGAPATVTNNSPFDTFAGSISEGGSAIAVLTGLELELNNNMNPNFVLMQKTVENIDMGRSNLSGTLTAYFENDDLLNKFLNETETSLEFTITDLDGNSYTFDIPRMKFNGGNIPVNTEGSLALDIPWMALRDATLESNIQVQRTPVV